MSQYEVFSNPNPRSRESVPYIVDVQSALLAELNSRLTMPRSRVGEGHAVVSHRLVPSFVVSGERLSLLAHAAAGIDAGLLHSPVASLVAHAGELRDALDAVVSGI